MRKARLAVWSLAGIALMGIGFCAIPMGCSDPSVRAPEKDAPRSATTTTPARGTMKAGVRNRKTTTAIPQP